MKQNDQESQSLEGRLAYFWDALQPVKPLIADFQRSRRFPELTYLREDLIGNYKERKYQSLVPWMLEQGFETVDIRGSSHSSNLLKLGLKLRAVGIRPRYQLEGREGPPVGNGLLSRMLLADDFTTEPFDEESDWVVPEGGSCPQALRGSLGIAGSVVENMRVTGTEFQDIYIDSGTGFTTAALLLGLGVLGVSSRVIVVSMTGQTSGEIQTLLEGLEPEFIRIFGQPSTPVAFEVQTPPIGQSFGSVPAAVFAEIEEMAQSEGLLVDPLYTAKLSLTYKALRDPERSSCLFTSGGSPELLGFQAPLGKWLEAKVFWPEH